MRTADVSRQICRPVLTYCAAVRLELRSPNPNPNSDPNLQLFELKIGTMVTPAGGGDAHIHFCFFSAPCSFRL